MRVSVAVVGIRAFDGDFGIILYGVLTLLVSWAETCFCIL